MSALKKTFLHFPLLPWWVVVMSLAVVFTGVALGEQGVEVSRDDDDPADASQRGRSKRGAPALTEDFDCSICHTPEGWKVGNTAVRGKRMAGFDHSAITGFALEGRHGEIPCMYCHQARQSGHNLVAECSGCHEEPHSARLGRHCERCHRPTFWHDIRAEEIHSTTQFPLTGRHLLADCTECHQRAGERQFSGVPTSCYSCHSDAYRRTDIHPIHAGSATTAPFPRDCSQCHRTTGWSPAVVDPATLPRRDGLSRDALSREDHDRRFPISYGIHRGAACDSCHVSDMARRAVRCTGCHVHNPLRLRAIHGARIGSPETVRCVACHPGGVAP